MLARARIAGGINLDSDLLTDDRGLLSATECQHGDVCLATVGLESQSGGQFSKGEIVGLVDDIKICSN